MRQSRYRPESIWIRSAGRLGRDVRGGHPRANGPDPGGTSSSGERKALSLRIDETIESVLHFLIRYFRTLGRLTVSPHRPEILVSQVGLANSAYVPPLTFLTIGAFLFALLIDVYPRGFAGLVDFVWMTDEIRANVSKRWKDAFSPTTLITAGLPTVLAVTSIAAASGRLLLRDLSDREKWFSAICYAFGYQTAAVFIVISLDSVYQALVIAFPVLDAIRLRELLAGYVPLLVIGAMVLAALLVPLAVIGAMLHGMLRPRGMRRAWVALLATLCWAATQYFYAAAASVLPELAARYFPKSQPKFMIFEEIAPVGERERGGLSFRMLVENPTDEDVVLELSPSDLELRLARGPDEQEPLDRWAASGWILSGRNAPDDSRRLAAPKRSRTIVSMLGSGLSIDAACDAYARIRKSDADNPEFKGALVQIFLSARVGVRVGGSGARTDRGVDTDLLCTALRRE